MICSVLQGFICYFQYIFSLKKIHEHAFQTPIFGGVNGEHRDLIKHKKRVLIKGR